MVGNTHLLFHEKNLNIGNVIQMKIKYYNLSTIERSDSNFAVGLPFLVLCVLDFLKIFFPNSWPARFFLENKIISQF